MMTVHKSKGLEFDTIVFLGLDDRAWWAHTPGDPEGVAAFFVALSRAKQRAIFAFCQQRGQRNNVAELYQLLTAAGVPEITIRWTQRLFKYAPCLLCQRWPLSVCHLDDCVHEWAFVTCKARYHCLHELIFINIILNHLKPRDLHEDIE